MADYTKLTNFTVKDALTLGDPSKIVSGTEIDDEFKAIQTAVNSKANITSPTFSGVPGAPTAGHTTNTTQIASTAFVKNVIMNMVYPIGSIYTNATNSTNPGTLLGFGTWVEFGKGRVMVSQNTSDSAFNSLQETGGSANAINVSHNHTTNSTGNHTHSTTNGISKKFYDSGSQYSRTVINSINNSSDGAHSHTVSTTGSSGTDKNLQPYIVVKMWKRTA